MTRIDSDFKAIRATFTEAKAENTAKDIALLLGLTEVSLTHRNTLDQFARQLKLPASAHYGFATADLVFQARDSAGQTAWYAVEISWTAGPRNLERARRNADLLRQATGQPAYALIGSDYYEEHMDWTNVQWVDLSDD